MYCKNCNKLYSSEKKFCPQCGQPLEDELNIYGVQLYQGKQDAFKKIYDATYKWVEKEVDRKGILKADIEDCMQEFYIHVYQKIQSFDPEKGTFRPWFNTVLKNKLEDYSRKSRSLTQQEIHLYASDSEDDDAENDQFTWMESTDFLPEEEIDQQETRRLIHEILDQLTDAQKQCVMMQFEKQMKIREIAEALDISEGTVKSAVSYGKKKIKEYVLALEKKGTKLYGMAPIPFFLWLLSKVDFETGSSERVWHAVSHQIFDMQSAAAQSASGVAKEAAGSKASATGSAASKAAATAASGTAKATMTKAIVGIVVAAAVTGSAAGVYVHHKNSHQPVQEEQQVAEKPAKEEKPEETLSKKEIYQLYYDKIQELEQQYGEIGIGGDDYEFYYTGVCYSELTDFNQDEQNELLVAYKNTADENDFNYTVEVWDVIDAKLTKIYSEGQYQIGTDADLDTIELDGTQYLVSGSADSDMEEETVFYYYDDQEKKFVSDKSRHLYAKRDGQETYTENGKEISLEEYNKKMDEFISNVQEVTLASSEADGADTQAQDALEATKQVLATELGIEVTSENASDSNTQNTSATEADNETEAANSSSKENQDAKQAFSQLLSGSDYVEDWYSSTSTDLSFQYYELTSDKIPVLVVYSESGIHYDMVRVYQYINGQVELAVKTAQIDDIYLQSGLIATCDSGMGTITETFYQFNDKNTLGSVATTFVVHDYDDDSVQQQFDKDVHNYANGEVGVKIDDEQLIANTQQNRDEILKQHFYKRKKELQSMSYVLQKL